jgi:carboxyl-terminal processing protease
MRLRQVMVFLLIHGIVYGQKITPEMEAVQLKKMLLLHHVQPISIDDNFSQRVWSNLLEETDPDRLFFLAGDISKLDLEASKIDNDLNTGTWKFFPLFLEAYKTGLLRAKAAVEQCHTKQVNFLLREKYVIDTSWAKDENEFNDRWRLLMKSEILLDLARLKKPEQGNEQAFLVAQEPASREKIYKAKMRGINRIYEHPTGLSNYVKTIFFKSISAAFDPHSEYMSLEQMQEFVAMLSTEGFFFGFAMHENEQGQLSVTNLVPGEPAWKSGVMEVGDVIERIRWEGKEWIDLTGVSPEELDMVFAESNSAFMEFILRKPDGTQKTVKLKKEKQNDAQSLVRGFLLEGKRTIGYIALPNFYSSFDNGSGARCANDVAKEIVKLKNHKLEGLILDLRYNGGGSLKEAVDMAGIFVDAGPIGIEKERDQDPLTIKDVNRGTIFDGPLVIIVNGYSASASEFLAAALQDYHRAIIVGSQTFGKAIAQEMFSLQPGNPAVNFEKLDSNPGWGFSTITTAKIYRINGKTIQKSGLTPDITLPDLFTGSDGGERTMAYSLASDSILKKTYYQPFAGFPLKLLQQKSDARLLNHPAFNAVREYSDYINEQETVFEEILDWNTVKQHVDHNQKLLKNVSAVMSQITPSFSIGLHEYGKIQVDQDQYIDAVNNAWIKNLSRDIFLEEAFNIICDYIDMQNRN